jgi:hypothetical protein
VGLPIPDDEYLYGIGGSLSSAAMQMEAQDASITTRKIQPGKTGSRHSRKESKVNSIQN